MKTSSLKVRDRQQYSADSKPSRGSSNSPTSFMGLMFRPFSILFNTTSEREKFSQPKKSQPDYFFTPKQKQQMLASSGKRSSSSSHLQSAGLSFINDGGATQSRPIKSPSTASIEKASMVVPKPTKKSSGGVVSPPYDPYLDTTPATSSTSTSSRTPITSSGSSGSAGSGNSFSMVNPARKPASGSTRPTSMTGLPPLISPGIASSLAPSSASPSLATSSSSAAASPSPAAAAATPKTGTPKVLCCDKCDGKHETDNCPYYKKSRENHPDAQKNKLIGGTSSLPGNLLRNARVVRQPGDGSCLFHSMSYGLRSANASSLRAEICRFIQTNPSFPISDTPLKDWVKWDSGASVDEYARNMSRGSWGGGIEMAVTSQLKGCNVHVYERCAGGFKRISAFDHPDSPASRPVVRVLYCGGVHYDALVAQ